MISSKVAGEVYNEIIDRDSLQIVLDPDKDFATYESVIDKVKERISIRKRRGEMADELMQRIDDKSSEDGYDIDY